MTYDAPGRMRPLDLEIGSVVDLYAVLDEAGAVTHRLTPGPGADGNPVRFGGDPWSAVPIGVEGAGSGGRGSSGRATLRLGRLDPAIDPRGEDWLGRRLRRWRTLERYLDGASHADPSARAEQVWWIERERSRTRTEVVFSLATPLDLTHLRVPGRQVLRDQCIWRYRHWDGSAWVYADESVGCPYRGESMWTSANEVAAEESLDLCPGTQAGCELRFPDQALPMSSFLGVAGAARS